MTEATQLLRQVHPTWFQEGRVTSQAFKPTAKDNNRLSVYNGDLISASQSWMHCTIELKNSSIGVIAVTLGECQIEQLDVEEDMDPFPEHASIKFEGLSNSEKESKAKSLRRYAVERDWLYLHSK
jgi:hypothetical protein